MKEINKEVPCSWEHVYLLGWYDRSGRPYLTSWGGDMPVYDYVVVGCSPMRMPMWDAQVPENAKVYSIPVGKTAQDYAKEMGGYHAIGWRSENPIKRK